VVKSSPEQVILGFSEIVELDSVAMHLYDWQGRQIDISPPELVKGNAAQVSAKLPPLEEGSYIVKWSLLSEDGHPVSDTFIFSIGRKSEGEPAPIGEKSSALADSLLVGLRFIVEALLLIAGGTQLVAWLTRRYGSSGEIRFSERFTTIGWFLLFVCLIAQGMIYTHTLTGSDFSLLMKSPFVIMLLAQLFLLVAIVIPGMAVSWHLLIWLLLIVSPAFGGHAWGITPVWAAIALRLLHLLAIALWLGSLVYLLLAFFRQEQDRQHLLKLRAFFLRLLFMASLGAVLSGVLMTSLQTDLLLLFEQASLWSLLLMTKATCVAIMLLIALAQTINWRSDASLLSKGLLRWELAVGFLAVLAGVWLSQTPYSF
jgi:copper transport protein